MYRFVENPARKQQCRLGRTQKYHIYAQPGELEWGDWGMGKGRVGKRESRKGGG
jgi:hypothetical protein